MAKEPFLINPHRLSRNRRQQRGGLPKRLLSRMMKTYGPGRGMSEAWSAFRRGVKRNTPSLGFLNPRRRRRHVRRRNPFGESVMIVGGNPRRRRRIKRKEVIFKMARVRRKRKVRRHRAKARRRFSIKSLLGRISVRRRRRRSRKALAMNPRRRRYRRRRVRLFNDNPRRRRRHSRRRRTMFFDNPRRRRYRRRFRSNPLRRVKGGAGVPALSFAKPMSMLMPAVMGTAGYMAADKIPAMVNVTTTLPRLGVKAAVGFGGGMLISKFLGRQNGAIFAIGVSINLLSDILNTYVLKSIGLSGFSAFPYQFRGHSGVGAYPQEFGDYPTGESYPM